MYIYFIFIFGGRVNFLVREVAVIRVEEMKWHLLWFPFTHVKTLSQKKKKKITKFYEENGEGNGTPLQYFCLENPMDRGAWYAAVHGLARVGHDWATSVSLFTSMHWRRKWQPTPVFLPGESQVWEAWWAAVYGVAQSRTRLKQCSRSMKKMHISTV